MKTGLRINPCVCFALVVILIGGICAALAQPSNGVKLNQNAFRFAAGLIRQGHFIADHKGGWSEHRPSADEENDLFVSMDSRDMPNGIWESMIASLRTRSDDTNFRMAISEMFIDALCLQRKPEPASTATAISEKQRQN